MSEGGPNVNAVFRLLRNVNCNLSKVVNYWCTSELTPCCTISISKRFSAAKLVQSMRRNLKYSDIDLILQSLKILKYHNTLVATPLLAFLGQEDVK